MPSFLVSFMSCELLAAYWDNYYWKAYLIIIICGSTLFNLLWPLMLQGFVSLEQSLFAILFPLHSFILVWTRLFLILCFTQTSKIVYKLFRTDNSQSISSMAINNTGDWIALGCASLGQLLVWEWQSDSYIMKQQGHAGLMNCLAYSPDGLYIATGGEDGKVCNNSSRFSHGFLKNEWTFFFKNTIFVSSHMYPENPEGTKVIVGSMNMGYISDTARNRTHNLFHPKREPIPLSHSYGQ